MATLETFTWEDIANGLDTVRYGTDLNPDSTGTQ